MSLPLVFLTSYRSSFRRRWYSGDSSSNFLATARSLIHLPPGSNLNEVGRLLKCLPRLHVRHVVELDLNQVKTDIPAVSRVQRDRLVPAPAPPDLLGPRTKAFPEQHDGFKVVACDNHGAVRLNRSPKRRRLCRSAPPVAHSRLAFTTKKKTFRTCSCFDRLQHCPEIAICINPIQERPARRGYRPPLHPPNGYKAFSRNRGKSRYRQ